MITYQRALDAEMAAAFSRMQEISAGRPDRYSLPFAAARAQLLEERRWWLDDAPEMESIREEVIPRSARPVTLRWHVPHASLGSGLIVYLHGGGWCVGSNDTHAGIMRHLAIAARLPVVGVDYSLAPEYPFPCAIEDVAAAVSYIVERSRRRFILAGDSAGANLALVEAMRRCDESLPQACGLLLFYGAFGPLREDGSGAAYGSGEFGLSLAAHRGYLSAYLGDAVLRQRDWRAYPLRGRLDDLPRALIIAAQLDPLLDDSLALTHRLAAAGNPVTQRVYPGVAHGFLSFTRVVRAAREAIEGAGKFAASACA